MASNNNMYRVGDFVYFESTPGAPYQIRRIDELTKTTSGAVEAKVTCYYRRRDVSSILLEQVKRFYTLFDSDTEDDDEQEKNEIAKKDDETESNAADKITKEQKIQIRHRELFLSRQTQNLPATHIRGKCSVTLYNGVEPITNYLKREDSFFYKLIYDPNNKTLQEDRGALRIGSEFQCRVQPLLKEDESDIRMEEVHEYLVWNPDNALDEQDFENLNILTRAIGTYARANDLTVPLRQGPLLLEAVTGSCRDITLQFYYDLIHKSEYRFDEAVRSLIPNGQPILMRDQLEEWSPSEHALFEEGLEKYSKSFADIRSEFLPWKTHSSLIEMYYFWKTTDRYVKKRRTKLAAQEHKLKQVYIPNYNKPNQTVLYHNMLVSSITSGQLKPNVAASEPKECQSCKALNSQHWFGWNNDSINSSSFTKICSLCWAYWKKFGGLKAVKIELQFDMENTQANPVKPGVSQISITAPNGSVLRGGGTHCLITPISIKLMRNKSKELINLKRIARKPGRVPESIVYEGKFDEAIVGSKIRELVSKLIEKAKDVIGDDDGKKTTEEIKRKREMREGKVKRTFEEKKSCLYRAIDNVAKKKNIELLDKENEKFNKDDESQLGKKRQNSGSNLEDESTNKKMNKSAE